jgi:hypothetical protein
MKRIIGASVTLLVALAVVAVAYHPTPSQASDHDDGDADLKGRALNLTDHFAFKSPASPDELSIITYFNPRSLPGRQYFMSTEARYEQHITLVSDKTATPTGQDDFVLRYEAGAPDAGGVQQVKLTVLKDMGGTLTEVGNMTGATTDFANSKAGGANIHINTGSVGGLTTKWFIGARADSFVFDVQRFFQVRAFLADRFFGGGAPNKGNTAAALGPNCRGDQFLALGDTTKETQPSDGDVINLWNPPSCAPDFTKNYNVTAIVMNLKIAELTGTVFDTWSTISVPQAQ